MSDNSVAFDRYIVGVDFGTLSGRAVVVRVADGAELGTARADLGGPSAGAPREAAWQHVGMHR